MGVRSLSLSLAGSGSPGVMTCAVLVTAGNAAASTATVSVRVRLSPGAIGSGSFPATIGPEVRKVKPVLLAATKLSPAGSVSTTVVVPIVAPVPRLRTTSV